MKHWPVIATLLGIVLLALGLLWPSVTDPASSLSAETAKEYYDAHRDLERATARESKNIANNATGSNGSVEEARRRFEAAKGEVDAAKSARSRLTMGLKISGAVLALLGAVGIMMQRDG